MMTGALLLNYSLGPTGNRNVCHVLKLGKNDGITQVSTWQPSPPSSFAGLRKTASIPKMESSVKTYLRLMCCTSGQRHHCVFDLLPMAHNDLDMLCRLA